MAEIATSHQHPLSGRLAVVTGGSRGIGFMIARGLLEAGAKVIISSRKAGPLEDAADELRAYGECVAVPADVGTPEGLDAVAAAVGAQPVHVLVNNAGAAWGGAIDEYPAEAFDKVLNVNVKSVFTLTQRLLPSLRAGGSEMSPARVINVGSVDGLRVPEFDTYAYSASKAAVHMLTRHLALRLASEHITVNAIAAGPFPSQMMAFALGEEENARAFARRIPLGRIGRPDDIAGLTVFLAGPGATWMTGAVIPLDGGYTLRN